MSGLTAPWFLQVFFDPSTGKPLSGGKMYFFVAGSTIIPKNVYADYPLQNVLPNPLTLDSSGTAPEYYMESGLYKVVVTRADGNLNSPVCTRDNIAGVGPGSGTGSDTYTVMSTANDGDPDYLANKLLASSSVTWTPVQVGSNVMLRADVNAAAVLDGKVKVGAGDTSGYLAAKLEQGTGILVTDTTSTVKFAVNTTWLSAWLASQGYNQLPSVPASRVWVSDSSGTLTSYANFQYDGFRLRADSVEATTFYSQSSYGAYQAETATARLYAQSNGLEIINSSAWLPLGTTSVSLSLFGLTAYNNDGTWPLVVDRIGRNGQIAGRVQFSAVLDGDSRAFITDDDQLLYNGAQLTVPALKISGFGAGVLSTDDNGNVTVNPAIPKVAVSATDTIPGYLQTKIAAGTGIRITKTTDGINGEVLHVSTTAGSSASGFQSSELTYAQRAAHAVNTVFNLMSLTLPAGTWDVAGSCSYNCGVGSSSYAQLMANFSTASATLNDDAYQVYSPLSPYVSANPGGTQSVTLAPRRYVLATATTIYLCMQHWGAIAYGGEAWGNMTARQVA